MLSAFQRYFRDRPRWPWWFLLVPLIVPALAAALALQLTLSTPMDAAHAWQVAFETWRAPFFAAVWGCLGAILFPLGRGRWRVGLPLHAAWFALHLPITAELRQLRIEPPFGPGEPPPYAREDRFRPPPPEEGGPPRGRRPWALLITTAGQLNLAAYFGTILLVNALVLARDVRERDRRARELAAGLSRARLQALQLQLQPHFLFNSLNAISTLVHKDAAAADEMISNLGELLRLSLATAAPAVPLREELALLDRYLAIEQVRFGPRLKIEREIAPEALGAFVPTLLLQPIVENAVRHGLEPKLGAGLVRLTATLTGGRLRIIIGDDGVGLPAIRGVDGRGGVGLRNTEERLAEIYGASAVCEIVPGANGGTRVTLEFPAEPPLGVFPNATPKPTV